MGSLTSPTTSVASPGSDGAKPAPGTLRPAPSWILLAPELLRRPGGIARVSQHYLRALADEAGRLQVIAFNDVALPAQALDALGAGQARGTGAARSRWRCLRELLAATAEPGSVVLCTHVRQAPLLWLLRHFARPVRFLVVLHGIEAWRPLPWGQRAALRAAEHVLCVSRYTRDQVARHHPNLAPRLRVLPNALDPGFPLRDTSAETVAGRILCVTRLAAHDRDKGVEHLINALPGIVAQRPDAHLRIVGDGPLRPHLHDLARTSTVASRITFVGTVDEASLRREYATAAVFALPSRKEGFGLVYLEALAAGKPCVAVRAGGVPEILTADCGLLVGFGDVTGLAAAVAEALARDWDRTALLARAEHFSFAAFRRRWQAVAASLNP